VPESQDVDATVQRIEELIEQLGGSDPQSRDLAEEAIRLLMQLYGAGFTRIIEMLGSDAAERMAEDKLVSSLLILHGLHPVPVETRIAVALRRVERGMDGGHLSIAEISAAGVRVRADLNGGSTPPAALAAMIERAITDSAPDAGAVEIEGLPEPAVSLVQIGPAAAR